VRTRREFITLLGGAGVILGLKSESAAAEPPPETTRIRIHDAPIACFAPAYIAEELLKAEGLPTFSTSRRRSTKARPRR